MVFVIITLLAIVLYIRDYKIPALLLFFFFLTSGLYLIPEEITEFAFISKGVDYAFFILLGIITVDSLFVKQYLKPDEYTKYLFIFGSFIAICALYSKYSVGLSWPEIIRTCRYHFFWAAYFVFRNMEKTQLERLLKYLFDATVFISVIYLLQIAVDESILVGETTSGISIFGIEMRRYYNQPNMIHFFSFMAIYNNPYKGPKKIVTSILLVLGMIGPLHRSLLGAFFIAVSIGYILRLPRLKRIKVVSVVSFLVLCVVVYGGTKFLKSRTFMDLQYVASGNFIDSDIVDWNEEGATFTFRIAHLLERNQYLLEHPQTMILGAGLIPEDSKKVEDMFDFKVGLVEELLDRTSQLETGDISYSILLLRLGYAGTLLNLLLFIYLMVFFYKKRENRYGFFSFLYLVLVFIVSFFSANLTSPVLFLLPLISYLIIKKTEQESIELIAGK
ncbi:MAG: hypothetical protein LBO74_07210 [Candidatus Symbiothrix sp.]|jgi:hypothetical protein|nr:hypothetical protein [Candidatus Symbiothrix sp.]